MVRPLCAMGAYAELLCGLRQPHIIHFISTQNSQKYHLKSTQFLPYYKKSKVDPKTPNFPITSKSKHSIFAIFLNEIINIMESIFATLLETLITF